jgi:glycosyltransferase involved in cell wall biosynthesis
MSVRAAISVGLYPIPGETFVHRHIAHLFGGNTCVVTTGLIGEVPDGVPAHVIPRRPTKTLDRLVRPVTSTWNSTFRGTPRVPVLQAQADLRAFLRDQRVDIVLAEFGGQLPRIAGAARALGIPVFVYFRGMDATAEPRSARRRRGLDYWFRHTTGVIAVSRFLLDTLAEFGLQHPNSHVIPSGVDTELFRPAAKRPLSFVAVGRMVEKKSPETTVRAFAAASTGRPEARLRFLGDGPREEAARALATELGVADRVSFEGLASHDTVRAALADSAVFLQHSVMASDGDAEGLPTAIQEAMAAGCVTVSTRHAGIPEAIEHGRTGFLCAEHDLEGYSSLIRRTMDEDVAAIAAAARAAAVERFDVRRLLVRLEDVLKAAL